MTDEQRTNILEQDKLAHQTRYAAQQEQLKTLFLKIGCNNIDNYIEDMMEGDEMINGALYHRIGGLMLKENYPPAFAQIYFYDSNMDNQFKRRQEIFP
ncbi:unnamed protein product [Rhizophagus irregularis]|nr:unnamed protein product [Rhizophagus irregularis]